MMEVRRDGLAVGDAQANGGEGFRTWRIRNGLKQSKKHKRTSRLDEDIHLDKSD